MLPILALLKTKSCMVVSDCDPSTQVWGQHGLYSETLAQKIKSSTVTVVWNPFLVVLLFLSLKSLFFFWDKVLFCIPDLPWTQDPLSLASWVLGYQDQCYHSWTQLNSFQRPNVLTVTENEGKAFHRLLKVPHSQQLWQNGSSFPLYFWVRFLIKVKNDQPWVSQTMLRGTRGRTCIVLGHSKDEEEKEDTKMKGSGDEPKTYSRE